MTPHFECDSEAAAFDQSNPSTKLNLSTEQAALPSRRATSANPPATTGSAPGPQATSRPSGTADNSSSHSTHTESSESSFRIAGKAARIFRERTSPPETPSPFPEISRALPRAAFLSTNSGFRKSPDTAGRSLPLPCAASAKPAKAGHEKESRRNKHSRFR